MNILFICNLSVRWLVG